MYKRVCVCVCMRVMTPCCDGPGVTTLQCLKKNATSK